MEIKSPITNNFNVMLEDELDHHLIIDAYKKDYNIDVSEYFEGVESVKIYRCLDTGYRFYFPLSLAAKSQLYEELQKQNNYYGIKVEHQVAETFVKISDLVLEIGCGDGFFLEKLQQRGVSCTGLEFNEEAVQIGNGKNLNVLSQDIEQHSQENYEKYDIVCYFQVLEHIPDVYNFIQASINALKPGGKLIIGVPNSNPFLYRCDKYHTLNLPPHHMSLWDTKTLINFQKIFDIQLSDLFVEPLQYPDYEYYFKLQLQHLNSKFHLFSRVFEFFLLNMRPTRIRRKIQKVASKFFQGRNILAIYTKA